jgi:hypothetical protein
VLLREGVSGDDRLDEGATLGGGVVGAGPPPVTEVPSYPLRRVQCCSAIQDQCPTQKLAEHASSCGRVGKLFNDIVEVNMTCSLYILYIINGQHTFFPYHSRSTLEIIDNNVCLCVVLLNYSKEVCDTSPTYR